MKSQIKIVELINLLGVPRKKSLVESTLYFIIDKTSTPEVYTVPSSPRTGRTFTTSRRTSQELELFTRLWKSLM